MFLRHMVCSSRSIRRRTVPELENALRVACRTVKRIHAGKIDEIQV